MTLGRRLFLGVLFGALIGLLVHPRSRPLLLLPFGQIGASTAVRFTPVLPRNLEVLAVPRDEVEFGLWMQAGAERYLRKRTLAPSDSSSLLRVAERGRIADPENAFWSQMEAVILRASGRQRESFEAWNRAAGALRWDDYQTERLKAVAEALGAETGTPMSWHLARAYSLRSNASPRAIEIYGRDVIARSGLAEREGLIRRYWTLRNGLLLRDGSRALQASVAGVNLVETACYPKLVLDNPTHRTLLLARYGFIDTLHALGMPREAEQVNRAYLTNDAWLALSDPERAPEHFETLAAASIALAAVPGSILAVVPIGAVVLGFAALLRSRPRAQAVLRPPVAQAIGFALAVGLYVLTEMPLVALTAVLSFGFVAFEPVHARTNPPAYFGPFFRFTVVMLAAIFCLLVASFVAGLSTPALELLPYLNAPTEFYGGQTLPLGLAGIVLALLALVGPSWALVLRVSTPIVVLTALREFGICIVAGCLVFTAISTPVAIYFDYRLAEIMQKLLTNEPTYYMLQ